MPKSAAERVRKRRRRLKRMNICSRCGTHCLFCSQRHEKKGDLQHATAWHKANNKRSTCEDCAKGSNKRALAWHHKGRYEEGTHVPRKRDALIAAIEAIVERPINEYLGSSDWMKVEGAVINVTPREVQVLAARYAIGRPTMEEVAKDLGISKQRVSDLESSALKKILDGLTPVKV